MKISQETDDLARSLLAYEAASSTSDPTQSLAARVCEKLREPLCALAGVAGYSALLARALTLARQAATGLDTLKILEDGRLHSEELPSQIDQHHASEGEACLTAQLLGLFLSLLGTAVTLQLVHDVFPNLTVRTEAGTVTPFKDILKEVGYLKSVSDRLELLAGQNPSVEEALMSVSGNVRNTATVLEVLAIFKTKTDEPQAKMPKQQRERYLN